MVIITHLTRKVKYFFQKMEDFFQSSISRSCISIRMSRIRPWTGLPAASISRTFSSILFIAFIFFNSFLVSFCLYYSTFYPVCQVFFYFLWRGMLELNQPLAGARSPKAHRIYPPCRGERELLRGTFQTHPKGITARAQLLSVFLFPLTVCIISRLLDFVKHFFYFFLVDVGSQPVTPFLGVKVCATASVLEIIAVQGSFFFGIEIIGFVFVHFSQFLSLCICIIARFARFVKGVWKKIFNFLPFPEVAFR